MVVQAEKWVHREKFAEVFKIELETVEDLKNLLGATDASVAYNRNRTILIEWTMMHRESFAGLVGQYVVRNDKGVMTVMDVEDLLEDYKPYVEHEEFSADTSYGADLGKLLAVESKDGRITEALFQLPDGSIETFVAKGADIVTEEPEQAVPYTPNSTETTAPLEQTPKAPSPADIHRAAKAHNNQEKTDND